jgi:hypothetical protein
MRLSRVLLTLCGTLSLACGSEARVEESSAGLTTVIDSTKPDSVIARTAGAVPEAAVRTVIEELRIQPDAEDTSSFSEVYEFDVARDGRMYVFDYPGRRFFLFGADGAIQKVVGRKGGGPGEFQGDNGMIVLRDGRLAILDAQNARLNFFSGEGEFQNSWVVPAGFSTNEGVRTDTSGTLFLVRPVTPRRDGDILGRMGLVRLADDGQWRDSLVAPDLPVARVYYTASKDGNTSMTGPMHAARFLWAWHPHGFFVSSATDKYELEISAPGRGIRIVRDAPEVPVPDDERAWDQERITRSLRGTDPSWVWQGPEIPKVKPPIRMFHIARDGRIWVSVSTPSQRIPDAERGPVLEGRPVPALYRDRTAYEVFSPRGVFLGRVQLPGSAQFMEADGDRLWVLERDADDMPGVVRYRVSKPF